MTKTDKPVTRETVNAYPAKTAISGRGFGQARPISVTIAAGDVLILRPKGTRQREYISIDMVYRYAVTTRVRSEAAQKLNAKRRKS